MTREEKITFLINWWGCAESEQPEGTTRRVLAILVELLTEEQPTQEMLNWIHKAACDPGEHYDDTAMNVRLWTERRLARKEGGEPAQAAKCGTCGGKGVVDGVRGWATHRWSGWPGAVCLVCGIEDPLENSLRDGRKEKWTCPPCPGRKEAECGDE